MKKLWPALIAAMMVTGLAFAADDAAKPAAPPSPSDIFSPARLPALLRWNDVLISQMEEKSGTLHTDEAKKALADATAMAKAFRAGLEQLSAAFEAGKDDVARLLIAQLREKFPQLQQSNNVLETWIELDQAKTLQAERGKDNPDLNARYQRIIGLLNQRLDLQNQIGAVNSELLRERQALQQSIEGAPVNPPAAEPPKPAPAPEPKPEAKPAAPA